MLVKGPRVGALAVRMFLFSNVGFFPGGQDRITASPCLHYAQAEFSFNGIKVSVSTPMDYCLSPAFSRGSFL